MAGLVGNSKSTATKSNVAENYHPSLLDTVVIPAPNECIDREPVDLDQDIVEVLRRYETMYCAFVLFKVYAPRLTKVLEKSDIGKAVQNTIVDYSTAYALLGVRHVERIQMNMQYTVLQSALILTISMPLYIQLPDVFPDPDYRNIFSAIIGFAAFQQLIVIIGCTIISGLLNRPYAYCDGTMARVMVSVLLAVVTVVNYIGSVSTLVAMLVAGFARKFIDGAVQLYVTVVVTHVIWLFAQTNAFGVRLQDARSIAFYQKYCEPETGRLKEQYLKVVYAPDDEEEDDGEDAEDSSD
eukprot:gene12313-8805_t